MALLRNLFLASVALALDSPSSLLGAPLARRGDSEILQSLSLGRVESRTIYNTMQSPSWAGVQVQPGDGDNITFVTGTFAAPTLWGDYGSASIWVGLGGANCPNGAFRGGINSFINNGVPSYNAWYQFVDSGVYDFPGISVSAGEYITVTVLVMNSTWGVVLMSNPTTNQSYGLDVIPSGPQSFCLENAEWIVADIQPGFFADFENVTFTDAMASDPNSNITYIPSEPASAVTLIDLVSQPDPEKANRTLLTFVDVAGSTILIQRLSS